MVLTNLLPTLQTLDHADKLRVVQFLVRELAKEDNALFQWDAQAELVSAPPPIPPQRVIRDLEAGYRMMAADEAREADALAWAEATFGDVADETR